MKKIMSCLITCILLVSMVTINAAEIPADVYDTEFEHDVEILTELGITELGEEGLFMPYSDVTRAELAVMLKNLIRPENINTASKYSDVTETHYAAEAISYLTEQGYMSGYGDGIFKPDEKIKYNEIAKVAVSMLGYDKLAETEGGYPQGYLKVAANVGVLTGVSNNGEYINKGNIAKLLVNLFDINPVKLEFDEGQPVYTPDENYTMLNVLCGIYKENGIISANEYYSLYGDDISTKDTIKINNNEFIYNGAEDFTGYNVECYYSINSDDEYVVEAIIPLKKKNVAIKIEADAIEEYQNYIIKYYNDEDKLQKAKYDNNTIFIYNGKNLSYFETENLNFENGYIDWIDNDSDGIAECIKISEYYNMVIEYANNEKIIDKFDNAKQITVENYKAVNVYDISGEKINIADIKSGTVASIYKSKSGSDEIIKIIVSGKSVEGSVSKAYTKEGTKYVEIDGSEYVVYSGFKTFQSTEVKFGDNGTFLLDAYEKVVTFIKSSTDNCNLGILVRCKNYVDDEIGEEVIDLRIFTQGGSLIDVKVKDKFRLDNEIYKVEKFSEAAEIISSVKQEPVRFKVGASGNLTMLDTSKGASGGVNDKLTKGSKLTSSARYLATTKILEGQMVLDSNVVVFTIPSDFDNAVESDFSCGGIGYFVANSTYTGISSYYLDDKIPVDIAVLQGETSIINNKSNVALVTAVNSTINEDNDEVVELEVYANGKKEQWLTENDKTLDTIYKINKYARSGDTLEVVPAQKIEPGDLIKCSFDSHGAINKLAIVYDASSGKMISINPYHNDFHETGERYVLGEVNNRYENYIELIYTNASNAQVKEYHNTGVGKIYKINTKNKNIMEEISMSEISDMVHNQKAEKIITISEAGIPKNTYIYE